MISQNPLRLSASARGLINSSFRQLSINEIEDQLLVTQQGVRHCQVNPAGASLCRGRALIPSSADARLLSPDAEGTIPQSTVVGRAHEVPSNPEEVLDDSVNGEEALRLAWRLEPAHLSFALPGRLMGDLRSVVGVLHRIVDQGRHGDSMSGAIAPQLVGHQQQGLGSLTLQ